MDEIQRAELHKLWKLDEKLFKRFISKVEWNEEGCLVWMKPGCPQGYGMLWMDGRTHVAHRIAYRGFVGPIPAGAWVLHKCGNQSCVNPEHLYAGDEADSGADRVRRHTATSHIRPRFKVEEVRKGFEEGLELETLAERFGVPAGVVRKVLAGEYKYGPPTR